MVEGIVAGIAKPAGFYHLGAVVRGCGVCLLRAVHIQGAFVCDVRVYPSVFLSLSERTLLVQP